MNKNCPAFLIKWIIIITVNEEYIYILNILLFIKLKHLIADENSWTKKLIYIRDKQNK